MITIHSIDETLLFYGSLGAKKTDTRNGSLFTFSDQSSYVQFWGDLPGFCAASVDVVFPRDILTRSQFHERYIGIGFMEEGSVVSYNRKADMRRSLIGAECYVFHSPEPLFMKIPGGQRLRFHGMYFQEPFFRENGLELYDSFWEDARASLTHSEIHSPELYSIYQHIENCTLSGPAFQIWMRGQGLAAAGHLLDLVQRRTLAPPICLSIHEKEAVAHAKELIRENLSQAPAIPELCRAAALNKNKLQKAFRLTEGKSIGEYIRTLRMERALELLETSTLSVQEIAEAVGCHSVSNLYRIFSAKFGQTPQAVREMLRRKP